MTRNSETNPDVGTAVESFLTDKSVEYADSTIRSYRSRLSKFVEFTREKSIQTLSELEHGDIDAFKKWRFSSNHSVETVKTQMDSLRMFLEWCSTRQYVDETIPEVAKSPNTRGTQRSDIVTHDRQTDIVSYLEKYRYASREHVVLAILSHTGMRAGAIRSIDIDDVDIDGQFIDLVHRPETGTPLKNQQSGERKVAISTRISTIIDDYITDTRINQTVDERKPLITTQHGRISRSAVREVSYRWTQPCQITDNCPHGRDIETCEFRTNNTASQCPSSSATHAWRRGVITALLSENSEEIVGGRTDVSRRVMESHYDQRDKTQKMEKRRESLGLD